MSKLGKVLGFIGERGPEYVALRASEIAAQVAVTDVADEFYEDFATEQSGRYWWWIRMILLDPNELIVDDGFDNLYRVPFSFGAGADEDADGDTNIVFGEPTPVEIKYVDVNAKSEVNAAAVGAIASVRGEKVAAKFEAGVRTRTQASNTEGEVSMKAHIAKLRAKLGLDESVSDEKVLELAAARLEADPDGGTAEPAPAPGGDPEPEGDPQPEGDPAPEPEAQPGTQASGNGGVLVDASVLADLRAKADRGDAAATKIENDERKAYLAAAIKVGKFPPAREGHYAALLAADPEGAKATIDALEPGLIPVQERTVNVPEDVAAAGYPASLFPDVAARRARIEAANGAYPRVTMEG